MQPQIILFMENNIYISAGQYWSRVPRHAVKSLPLEMFNTQLVEALFYLFYFHPALYWRLDQKIARHPLQHKLFFKCIILSKSSTLQ